MAALIAVAETAEDIGSALNRFLDPVADYAADITALIAQCFQTSSALRLLRDTIDDYPNPRKHQLIREDLDTARSSLHYTFKDVQRIFGGLGRTALIPGAAYRRVWEDLKDHFYEESGNTLHRRLEYYQQFLHGLTQTLSEGSPREYEDFDDVRDRIYRLLEAQDDRLADELHNTSLGVSNISKVPSFERKRPKVPARAPSPPPKPRKAAGPRVPASQARPMDDDWEPRRPRHPPPAPEVPLSPTSSTSYTFSSTQSSKSSSTTPSLPGHWLPGVFERSQPTTPLATTGQSSVSLGPDLGPEADKRLTDGYAKLLEMPFENGDLLVRLYQRPKDLKTRFLCKTLRPAHRRKDCCLPLTHLEVERDGPFLKFARITSTGSSQLWACLKFSNYEKLVLFFCSFLALRSEDSDRSHTPIRDSQLHDEEYLFGGEIIDDHYSHALRLFKDKSSGGVRLEASVLRGEMKKTPIWTAFITHQVQSRTWRARPSPKVIHLADLQRYIFTEDYDPQIAPTGEHELSFVKTSDLKDFVRAIDKLFEYD